jgi:hypothetical protein
LRKCLTDNDVCYKYVDFLKTTQSLEILQMSQNISNSMCSNLNSTSSLLLTLSRLFLSSIFFFFGSTVIWIQGLVLVKSKCSITWASLRGLLSLVIFKIRSCFIPGPVWTMILFFMLPQDDRCVPLYPVTGWNRGLWTFCPERPVAAIFLISSSWVAKITGFNHHNQCLLSSLLSFTQTRKHESY